MFNEAVSKNKVSRHDLIELYKGGIGTEQVEERLIGYAGPAPKNWMSSVFDSDLRAVPLELQLIHHIFANFYLLDRNIYKKTDLEGSIDIMSENLLFYEKLYAKAGPQMDVTTYPMFKYSRYSDIGQSMWVEMRQPKLGSGRDSKVDVLSLDAKTENMQLELGTGVYFIKAFEHTINSDNVKSRFRLHKNAYSPVGY